MGQGRRSPTHNGAMTITAKLIYEDGRLVAEPPTLQEAFDELAKPGRMAWIALDRVDVAHDLRALAPELGLHGLAVENALEGGQRTKRDAYGERQLVVLRPALYLDDPETVEYGELDIFVGPHYVVTVRHTDVPELRDVRQVLEREGAALLAAGPYSIVHGVLDAVVDGYTPVVEGLENDLLEIEGDLFAGETRVSRRIYQLFREVDRFHRAVHPLPGLIEGLMVQLQQEESQLEIVRKLRDVLDHTVRLDDRVGALRAELSHALELDSTMASERLAEISVRQNEQAKRIASWAAIIFAPQLVGSVYGMNFDVMPELHWAWGYPFALGLMLTVGLTLFVLFRRNDWL